MEWRSTVPEAFLLEWGQLVEAPGADRGTEEHLRRSLHAWNRDEEQRNQPDEHVGSDSYGAPDHQIPRDEERREQWPRPYPPPGGLGIHEYHRSDRGEHHRRHHDHPRRNEDREALEVRANRHRHRAALSGNVCPTDSGERQERDEDGESRPGQRQAPEAIFEGGGRQIHASYLNSVVNPFEPDPSNFQAPS